MTKKEKARMNKMSNIGITIWIVIMVVMGGVSSLYVLISLPAVIIWKLYRVIVKGYKITD